MNPELKEALDKGDELKIKELINLPDAKGKTPLMQLFSEDYPNIKELELLLDHGADVNIRTADGVPAVYLILHKPNHLKLILEKGNLNPFFAIERQTRTLLALARENHLYESAELLDAYEKKYIASHQSTDAAKLTKSQDLLKRIHFIKQKGHSLGISGEVLMEDLEAADKGKQIAITFENYSPESSIEHLTDLFNEYVASRALKPGFEKISGHLTAIQEAYQGLLANTKLAQKSGVLADRIAAGKLTILKAGWSEHFMSIAALGDHLIFCNRGYGVAKSGLGSQIYKFGDLARVRLKEKMINSLSDYVATEKEIFARINRIMPKEDLLEEIEAEDQKYGTCTFVNQKSIIRPILYLLERKKLALALSKPETDMDVMNKAEIFAKKEYKNFTRWMRDREIDDIVAQYKTGDKTGAIPKPILNQIVTAYIHQHFTVTKATKDPEKRVLEIERAWKLLQAMDENERKIAINTLMAEGNTLLKEANLHRNEKVSEFIERYWDSSIKISDAGQDEQDDSDEEDFRVSRATSEEDGAHRTMLFSGAGAKSNVAPDKELSHKVTGPKEPKSPRRLGG